MIVMGSHVDWHWTNESLPATLSTMTTLASTAHRPSASPALIDLVPAIRHVIALRADWSRTARLVADRLRAHLPEAATLTPEQRRGDPDRPAGHVLHAEPDGTFSILGLVWRPGQSTRIHDHITWCVVLRLNGSSQHCLAG